MPKHTVTYLAVFVSASRSGPKRKPRRLCEDFCQVPTPQRESRLYLPWIVRWYVGGMFCLIYACVRNVPRLSLSVPHSAAMLFTRFQMKQLKLKRVKWLGGIPALGDGARSWPTILFLLPINFYLYIIIACPTHYVAEITGVENVMNTTVIPQISIKALILKKLFFYRDSKIFIGSYLLPYENQY